MKNPVHPGELIADALEELGFSVAEAARGLGVSRQQLHNYVAKKRDGVKPTLSHTLSCLCQRLESSPLIAHCTVLIVLRRPW
jgi:hypothetical protein